MTVLALLFQLLPIPFPAKKAAAEKPPVMYPDRPSTRQHALTKHTRSRSKGRPKTLKGIFESATTRLLLPWLSLGALSNASSTKAHRVPPTFAFSGSSPFLSGGNNSRWSEGSSRNCCPFEYAATKAHQGVPLPTDGHRGGFPFAKRRKMSCPKPASTDPNFWFPLFFAPLIVCMGVGARDVNFVAVKMPKSAQPKFQIALNDTYVFKSTQIFLSSRITIKPMFDPNFGRIRFESCRWHKKTPCILCPK
jgi:hypothetical protein